MGPTGFLREKEATQANCGPSHLPYQLLSGAREGRSAICRVLSGRQGPAESTQSTSVPGSVDTRATWLGMQEPSTIPTLRPR